MTAKNYSIITTEPPFRQRMTTRTRQMTMPCSSTCSRLTTSRRKWLSSNRCISVRVDFIRAVAPEMHERTTIGWISCRREED